MNRIIKLLKEKKVSFEKGLSDKEVLKAEELFNLNFPKDLKLFLQTALPVGSSFVHWRYGINSEEGFKEISKRINYPKEDLIYDVENKLLWKEDWGEKPKTFNEQKEIVLNYLKRQPKLIPIYSHRFISSEPVEEGNPVFSIYQWDIIHYGNDLLDYFSNEFQIEIPKSYGEIKNPKRIRFWSDFIY